MDFGKIFEDMFKFLGCFVIVVIVLVAIAAFVIGRFTSLGPPMTRDELRHEAGRLAGLEEAAKVVESELSDMFWQAITAKLSKAIREKGAKPVCQTCGGTGLVSFEEMDGVTTQTCGTCRGAKP